MNESFFGFLMALVALLGTIANTFIAYLDKKNQRENETKLKLQEEQHKLALLRMTEIERKAEACEKQHEAAQTTILMNRQRIEELTTEVEQTKRKAKEHVEEVRHVAVEALRTAEEAKNGNGSGSHKSNPKGST